MLWGGSQGWLSGAGGEPPAGAVPPPAAARRAVGGAQGSGLPGQSRPRPRDAPPFAPSPRPRSPPLPPQIRRSSYHDVLRVADVTRLLDLSGVQVSLRCEPSCAFPPTSPNLAPAPPPLPRPLPDPAPRTDVFDQPGARDLPEPAPTAQTAQGEGGPLHRGQPPHQRRLRELPPQVRPSRSLGRLQFRSPGRLVGPLGGAEVDHPNLFLGRAAALTPAPSASPSQPAERGCGLLLHFVQGAGPEVGRWPCTGCRPLLGARPLLRPPAHTPPAAGGQAWPPRLLLLRPRLAGGGGRRP